MCRLSQPSGPSGPDGSVNTDDACKMLDNLMGDIYLYIYIYGYGSQIKTWDYRLIGPQPQRISEDIPDRMAESLSECMPPRMSE